MLACLLAASQRINCKKMRGGAKDLRFLDCNCSFHSHPVANCNLKGLKALPIAVLCLFHGLVCESELRFLLHWDVKLLAAGRTEGMHGTLGAVANRQRSWHPTAAHVTLNPRHVMKNT